MNIKELASICGKDIVIRQHAGQFNRWTAQIERTETKEKECDAFLVGAYGDSDSPQNALADYCEKISNKFFVINANSDTEMRFQLGKITTE
jgi:hypothetical protein